MNESYHFMGLHKNAIKFLKRNENNITKLKGQSRFKWYPLFAGERNLDKYILKNNIEIHERVQAESCTSTGTKFFIALTYDDGSFIKDSCWPGNDIELIC